MKNKHIVVIGLVAIRVGMGFVMPAVAQWRNAGKMTTSSVGLCLLGSAMTLSGIGAGIRILTKSKA